MTMLAIGDARCSLVMMQNTSGRLLQRCRCPGQNRVCLDAARIQRPDCFQITLRLIQLAAKKYKAITVEMVVANVASGRR